jgi:hypothetical protein
MKLSVPVSALVVVAALVGNARAQTLSFADYGDALKTYVNDRGMVNYAGLKAHNEKLDAFLKSIANLDHKTYGGWKDTERIAFWLNAYNACTLKAIIDHYPIKSSFLTSLHYPKNSIRQISGVWDDLKFTIMGRPMVLDGIEHNVLRTNYHEPRIHMALVCAAMGCPPLRNEPYTSERLSAQFDDQARRFLSNPAKFRIDRDAGRVYLSSIFKWFGDDFIPKYAVEDSYGNHSKKERATLHFVAGYLEKKDADYLASGNYDVKYLDYDWSLNEQ